MATVRFKRGLEATIPSLLAGEPAFTLDTSKIFIGSNNGKLQVPTMDDLNNAGGMMLTESFTATANQTRFTVTKGTIAKVGLLRVTVGGVLQDDVTLSSTTTFDLPTGISAGTKVVAEWFEIPPNFETLEGKYVDVSKYGYDLNAVIKAVADLKDGDTLYFPNALTTYQLIGGVVTIPVANITVTGKGLIVADYGFRPTASGFTADGLRMEAPSYTQNARAIQVDIPPSGTFLKNFNVRNCSFKNFFYACKFDGGSYTVTGNEALEGFPVRDVVIMNCYSETYTNQNAGHFNCTQVENVSYLNNRTYGGQNATSYNAIKGNGYIKVIGNYDDNNSYGSCEIENASGKIVIEGNTFKKGIWVDDSYSAVINGNYTDDVIKVTVGSNNGDANDVIISNNVAGSIRAEQFGTYLGGKVKNIHIVGNTLNATTGFGYGVWVHGTYVEFALIENNIFSGTYANAKIGVIRGTGCEVMIRDNIIKGTVIVSSTGGLVYKDRNFGTTWNGATDTLTYV